MNLRIKTAIKKIIKLLPIVLITLCISNCGSNGNTVKVTKTNGFQQNHGPFDANGNYIESWADEAPKRIFTWKKSKKEEPANKPKLVARNTSSTTVGQAATTKTYTPPRKITSPQPIKKSIQKPIAKKTTAKKITPKSKPPISHTVRKGDTLYGLARKYGTSVPAIQKANGIKGSNIGIGKRLIIPRK